LNLTKVNKKNDLKLTFLLFAIYNKYVAIKRKFLRKYQSILKRRLQNTKFEENIYNTVG